MSDNKMGHSLTDLMYKHGYSWSCRKYIEVSLSHYGFWEGCGFVPEMETESRLRVLKAKDVIEKCSTA